MYGVYVTNSSCTIADVINDLIKLTGGESIANCSASCNKSLTTQNGGYSFGWYEHDGLSGAGTYGFDKVFNVSLTYQTDFLRVYASNATTINLTLYKAWNESTNAGTNPSTGTNLSISTTAANTIWYYTDGYTVLFQTAASSFVGMFALDEYGNKLAEAQPDQCQRLICSNSFNMYSSMRRNPLTGVLGVQTTWRAGYACEAASTSSQAQRNQSGGFYMADGSRALQTSPMFILFTTSPVVANYGRPYGVGDPHWFGGGHASSPGDILIDGQGQERILFGANASRIALLLC